MFVGKQQVLNHGCGCSPVLKNPCAGKVLYYPITLLGRRTHLHLRTRRILWKRPQGERRSRRETEHAFLLGIFAHAHANPRSSRENTRSCACLPAAK